MNNNRTGLRRIIMIDGHIKGKRVEIKLDEHANLSGTNGAGKTTLLKLVPIFYGLTPGQIVKRTGGREAFVNYYLPRPTSLLIFEYTNKLGAQCAVISRHISGDKPVYRFLGGPFRIDYFSEQRGNEYFFLDGKSLARHWALRRLDHTRQIEKVTDYRAVIQGDSNLINRSSESRELRPLVASYSLTNTLGKMRHIDKLTSAILGRSGDMDRIKSMLADIMQEEGIMLPTLDTHKSVRETIAQLNTLRQLDKQTPYFRQTIAQGASYFEGKKRLDVIATELSILADQLLEELEVKESERAGHEESMLVLKVNWESRLGELQSTISGAQAQYDRFERELDELYHSKEKWEADDIEKKRNDYDNLDRFREIMDQAKAQFDALSDKVQNLEFELKGYLSDEESRHNKASNLLRNKEREAENEINQLESNFSSKQLAFTKKESAEIDGIKEKYNADIQEIDRAITEADYRSKHDTPTEQEQLNFTAAEQALDNARQKERLCRQLLDEQRKINIQSKRELDDALKELKHADSRLKQAEIEMERLDLLCRPQSGSLLYALRDQNPDWFDSIGRTIREDLLHRTDLSPSFEPGSESIHGWTLDLKRINKPDWASSIEDQEIQLNQQEDAVRLATQHQNEKDAAADKRKLSFDAAEKELAGCEQKLSAANNQVSACEQALRTVKSNNADLSKQRKAEAARDIVRLREQLKSTLLLRDKDIGRCKELYAELLNEQLSLKSLEEGRWQDVIASCKADLNEELNLHKKNIKTIKLNHKARCSKEGIDESIYDAAQKLWLNSQQQFKKVESYQKSIANYRHWLRTEWSRREVIANNLSEAKESLNTHQQAKAGEELEFTSKRDKTSANIERLIQSEKGLKQSSYDARALMTRLGKSAKPNTEITPRSLAQIQAEAETLLEDQQKLKSQIVQAINKAEGIISASAAGDNQIADVWFEHKRTIQAEMANPDDTELLNVALTVALEELLDDQIPQKRQSLISFVESTGGQLDHFYIALNEIGGLIKGQSRRISEAIGSTMEFDAISDIAVGLVSKIDQMDYWPKLKEFHSEWSLWKGDDESELPPKELDALLISTTDTLYRSKKESSLSAVFDLEISLKENGRPVTVRRNVDLEEVSSTGLSYLVLCSIFAGLSRMLCQDRRVNIHWPMDELGTLHSENIPRLFKLLDHYNIVMVGGFPTTDPVLLQHFENHHEIRPGKGLVELCLEEDELTKLMNERLSSSKSSSVKEEEALDVD